MSKNTGFISNLNRSTKITLLSCGCFIALTVVILVFFILFPITPSEKIMASIGRENIFNGGDGEPYSTVVPGVVTTEQAASVTTVKTSTTKPRTTTTRTYRINITTGSGFIHNGRIPTGYTGYEVATTPVTDTNQYPTTNTYDPSIQPTTNPYDPPVTSPATDVPAVTEPPVDPYVPPAVTDPPVAPPVDPPAGGDTGNGGSDPEPEA